MFLMNKNGNQLVEVLEVEELFNPNRNEITGKSHSGEEMQETRTFPKSEMLFPSGESLPLCWVDPDYREKGNSR